MSPEPLVRQARVERKSKETEVTLHLNLDGTGASKVRTPIPFFSHMLEAWAKHGLMDLTVEARGGGAGGNPHPRGGGGDLPGPGAARGPGGQKGEGPLRTPV